MSDRDMCPTSWCCLDAGHDGECGHPLVGPPRPPRPRADLGPAIEHLERLIDYDFAERHTLVPVLDEDGWSAEPRAVDRSELRSFIAALRLLRRAAQQREG